jgi:hypothetical protein
MKRLSLPGLGLLGTLATGCVSVAPPPPMAVLAISGKTCVGAPDLATAVALAPQRPAQWRDVITLVGATSGCVSTPAGDANYVLYSLPDHPANHTITVGGAKEVLRTFVPSVTVLDASGAVVRSFEQDRYLDLGTIIGVQFRPPAEARFVLVQSDPAQVGRAVTALEVGINTTTNYAYTGTAGVSYNQVAGVESTANRVYSHEGTVSLRIQAVTGKIGLPDAR